MCSANLGVFCRPSVVVLLVTFSPHAEECISVVVCKVIMSLVGWECDLTGVSLYLVLVLQGVDVQATLREFYSSHYSSHRMSVVVVSCCECHLIVTALSDVYCMYNVQLVWQWFCIICTQLAIMLRECVIYTVGCLRGGVMGMCLLYNK